MVGSEHLEMILDHLPSALILLSPERTVLYRNRTATILAPQLEVGMNVWEALRPIASEEKIDRMMRGERILLKTAPDQPVLEWLIALDRPEDGTLILMAWDAAITDEIIQGRITFIMGASHELRSPLTALVGFAEILELQRDTLTPSQAEAVGVILQNARHLQSMAEDILDLSRNSFGELRLELEPLDVVPIVESVGETLRPQIEARDQTLEVEIEPGLDPIEADSHRVRQIVINLVQNAHAHTPPGTAIRVGVRREGDGIVIEVADDGGGLPFEDPEDAFGSFRRGPTTVESEIPGSGIGLSITRRLVELHRGTITVASDPGEGSVFTTWLPFDRERARLAIAPEAP